MLDYYGYAANFENQRKNQEGALKFFIKDMELPKNPVFTQEETAEIYKKRQSNDTTQPHLLRGVAWSVWKNDSYE